MRNWNSTLWTLECTLIKMLLVGVNYASLCGFSSAGLWSGKLVCLFVTFLDTTLDTADVQQAVF